MDKSRVLTILSYVGVLAGMALVIIELQQNSAMMRAQTRNDISSQITEFLVDVAGNPELANLQRRAEAGQELTRDDEHRYAMLLIASIRVWENMHYQYRQGLFDASEFTAERAVWAFLIDQNARFAGVWCASRHYFSEHFRQDIDALVDRDCVGLGS